MVFCNASSPNTLYFTAKTNMIGVMFQFDFLLKKAPGLQKTKQQDNNHCAMI